MVDFHDPVSSPLPHPKVSLQPHCRLRPQSKAQPCPLISCFIVVALPHSHHVLPSLQNFERLAISTAQKANALHASQSSRSVPSIGSSPPLPLPPTPSLIQSQHPNPITLSSPPLLCPLPRMCPFITSHLPRPHPTFKGASSLPSMGAVLPLEPSKVSPASVSPSVPTA